MNNQQVMINLGSEDLVKEGDNFIVVNKGEEIIDPQTKKDLGRYDFVKDRLEVIEVFPNFSILSKITRKVVPMFAALPALGNQTRTEEIPENLNVDKDEISAIKFSSTDRIIHLNDLVRKTNKR
ncbi:hypothetical protein ACKP2L_05210 [Oenococcus alcoholitolerans]|uniref:hypothetical protein n=1 Tax=Oenococcus alcoholitolerans TaxID=931074 RepID=UPI003F71E0CB